MTQPTSQQELDLFRSLRPRTTPISYNGLVLVADFIDVPAKRAEYYVDKWVAKGWAHESSTGGFWWLEAAPMVHPGARP